MVHLWALLLDLDQTLVITTAIEPLRRQKQWNRIYSQFHLTYLPSGTLDFLKTVDQHLHLGVLTSSPRSYAERLLAYHQLSLPVTVAYHDTRLHKPHPEPLLESAKRLGIAADRCIYVGDTVSDLEAALRAGALPIGLSWDGSLSSASGYAARCTLCTNWDDVLATLRSLVPAKKGSDHE